MPINKRKLIKNYYCIVCDKKICYCTWHYGKQMCSSCASKNRFKNPKNHPNYINGKSHTLQYQRDYYKLNRNKIRLSQQKYINKNKEKLNKKSKLYQKNNREKINKQQKKRFKSNPNAKIAHNLRNRIRGLLKNKNKSLRTMLLIGCELDYLMYHLQNQFKRDMTWDNYGTGHNGKGMQEWHIDHIRPCASFDLTKEDEQRKCFHYTNLQPLWAKENLEKKET